MELDARPLEAARSQLGFSVDDVWIRCLGLGGLLTPEALGDALLGEGSLAAGEYDVIAQALNEEFLDRGVSFPVRYADNS